MFPVTDSTRSCRWRLSINPTCYRKLPSGHGVRSGSSVSSFEQPDRYQLLRRVRHIGGMPHTTRCPIGQGLETGAKFPEG
jgi:hypothetical protein